MGKRELIVDWKRYPGAASKKRILHLKANEENLFVCPIETCLKDPYKSSRGLRKHINTIHSFYFYFDEKPKLRRQDVANIPKKKLKCSTHKMPAFSLESGMGKQFLEWLQSTCGGGKKESEALQVGRRAMKFLMQAMGEPSEDLIVKEEFVDTILGSPSVILDFVRNLTEEWEIGSSGALGYMKSIMELMDFRKTSGLSDDVLRTFITSEVYIRRGRENLARQKKIDYARNLDLESLIARRSWASLEEMEKVIPYHSTRYEDLVKSCRSGRTHPSINDLAFTTRFIITFMFLRVKATRPASYRYLTIEMFEKCKTKEGVIHQTEFKTASKYAFDTIILTQEVISIIDTYTKLFRPLMSPKCEYLLITTNGKHYSALGTAMSILVHQAIGKVINPTRYRMIIETESSENLTRSEQESISRDQKHSSGVARRIYQRRTSLEVAKQGQSCMTKLVGQGRNDHNTLIANALAAEDDTDIDTVSSDEDINSTDIPVCENSSGNLEVAKKDKNEVMSLPDNTIRSSDTSNSQNTLEKHGVVSDMSDTTASSELFPTSSCTSNSTIAYTLSEPSISSSLVSLENSTITASTTSSSLIDSAPVSSYRVEPSLKAIDDKEDLQTDEQTNDIVLDSHETPLVTTKTNTMSSANVIDLMEESGNSVPGIDNEEKDRIELEVKKEEAQQEADGTSKIVRFTLEEDNALRKGIEEYGVSSWAKILKDPKYKFHRSRKRDSLRMRAETLKLKKAKRTSKEKVKNSTT